MPIKKTVLTFGLISGAVSSAIMLGTVPFADRIGFDRGEILGYTSIVLSFLFAIRPDAEVHEQERDDDSGVADEDAALEADFVDERHRPEHQRHGQRAGQQPEGENDFFHGQRCSFASDSTSGGGPDASSVRVILGERARNHPFRR